jgi:uncharacterized protein
MILGEDTRVLILPGLFGSGPEHWQTRWEAEHPSFRRLEQRDWETPDRAEWVATLHDAVTESSTPAVLVAHSLACSLIAHWARAHNEPIGGALLVAPADVEAPSFPAGTNGFSPMPMELLPFRSLLVASTNDPYVTVGRARQFAAAWGSQITSVGPSGHVNSDSGLGSWPEGLALLQRLTKLASRSR